jgi:hypothetical protein
MSQNAMFPLTAAADALAPPDALAAADAAADGAGALPAVDAAGDGVEAGEQATNATAAAPKPATFRNRRREICWLLSSPT